MLGDFWVTLRLLKHLCFVGMTTKSVFGFLPNVMMSHAVAWRGGCAAASVTGNRIGSIYLLGSFSFGMLNPELFNLFVRGILK
jgi:hypothetical protein